MAQAIFNVYCPQPHSHDLLFHNTATLLFFLQKSNICSLLPCNQHGCVCYFHRSPKVPVTTYLLRSLVLVPLSAHLCILGTNKVFRCNHPAPLSVCIVRVSFQCSPTESCKTMCSMFLLLTLQHNAQLPHHSWCCKCFCCHKTCISICVVCK